MAGVPFDAALLPFDCFQHNSARLTSTLAHFTARLSVAVSSFCCLPLPRRRTVAAPAALAIPAVAAELVSLCPVAELLRSEETPFVTSPAFGGGDGWSDGCV